MPVVRFPGNVTAITIDGVALVPDANGDVTVASVATTTALIPQQNQEYVVSIAANGDVTMRMPASVTSITIGGVAYVPDGSQLITVPAAPASLFMRSLKGQPLIYSRA